MSEEKPTHTLEQLITDPNIKFLFFGGKGGVGKTSCACSTALATALLGKKVLIMSTDPAHSTSDSFYGNRQEKIGSTEETKIYENHELYKNLELYGIEINPKEEFKKYKKTMEESQEVDPMIQASLNELMDSDIQSPPGADEAMGFSKVLEYINEKKDLYDLIIIDTAPTGHTLRLLDLPDLLDSFFGKLLKFRLKIGKVWGKMKSVFGKGGEEDKTLEMLDTLKKTIEEANKYLKKPENEEEPIRTNFVCVTIAEAMGLYETERLLAHLYEVEMPASNIIVNQIFPENPDCKFCKSRREMQVKNLKEIRDLYEDTFNISEVPLFDTEINGPEKLIEFAKKLYPNLLKDY